MKQQKREHWGSNWGFIMAAAGSAIGLGNIWKFPYITGMNGGGAFVLVYLCCIVLIGLPVMLAEFALGRASQSDPIGAFQYFNGDGKLIGRCFSLCGLLLALAIAAGTRNYGLAGVVAIISAAIWRWGFVVAGFFCSLVALLILSYYAVIGGWILIYAQRAFSGMLNFSEPAEAARMFGHLAVDGWLSAVGLMLYMIICGTVCFFGVKRGIEFASKVLMPILFVLILILVGRALTLDGAGAGVEFFLKPDFSKLSGKSVLEALGHAFYSLSLGMGILITYGSYLPRNRNIFAAAVSVAFFDTLIALLAGLAIFPAVFAMNMDPGAGPSLIFNILPNTFNAIPGQLGWLWNGLFFILMSIAALTSGISLLEAGVSSVMQHGHLARRPAVVVSTLVVAAFGVLSAASVANWDRLPGLYEGLTGLFGTLKNSFLDELDYVCSSWILPLDGLAIAIFTGWIWGVGKAARELYRRGGRRPLTLNRNDGLHRLLNMRLGVSFWSVFIRFVAPILVLITFLYAVGIIKF